MEDKAKYINILGDFCGKRDLDFLTRKELENRYGMSQADLMVLFGGSILCGGDVPALAMKNKTARRYVIVGGAGHALEDGISHTFIQQLWASGVLSILLKKGWGDRDE